MDDRLSQNEINSLINSVRTYKAKRENTNIPTEEHQVVDMEYENEIKAIKVKIQLLEKQLQEIKDLDKYEKIPYWLRPDFKIDFTYKS